MERTELDERLRWADQVRRKLRRATRELASLGEQIFRSRPERATQPAASADTPDEPPDRSR